MSIRNLDWSPLDLDSDPVWADPDAVKAAQRRYQHIATTIDDLLAKLWKVVDASSDSLAGRYVEGLRSDAESVGARLYKAAVRYHDAADEIAKYEPDLHRALSETAGALAEANEAQSARFKALSMPDPQQKPDGSTSVAEQHKGRDKDKATADADAALAAAKQRLNTALSDLNVAGKRLGDAVSCGRYQDGLTDTLADKIDAVFAKIATAFGVIGMTLAVIGILIPGVNVLALTGVAVGVVSLVANSTLYAHGKGSLVDVVLGAVGLGLAGVGAFTSVVGKGMSSGARTLGNLAGRPRLVPENPPQLHWGRGAPAELQPLGPAARTGDAPAVVTRIKPAPGDFVVPTNPATQWKNTSEWFNNPATNWLLNKSGQTTPDIGFWKSAGVQAKGAGSMWGTLFSDPSKFAKTWTGDVIGGLGGAREQAAVMAAVGGRISPLWHVWGGLNGAFNMGGLIYTGGRLEGWIPAVRPPSQVGQ